MGLKGHMRVGAILAGLALAVGPGLADELDPPPDASSEPLLNVAPAPPDVCARFGLRYWAKRVLFDKSGACRCIKCGWHISPPRRICWRVC